jgi:hypothetical protein
MSIAAPETIAWARTAAVDDLAQGRDDKPIDRWAQ